MEDKVIRETIKLGEGIIKIADQYGMNRDETMEYAAWIILDTLKEATFEFYELQEESKKPQTRIEYIRHMSVEELADEILKRGEISTVIDFCQNFGDCCETISEEECRKCLINWLNAPVEQKKAIPTEHFETRFNTVV